VGFEWLQPGLDALRGIEPQEVMQVLGGKRRWPRPATGPDGHRVTTIWGRTDGGRALIVAIRRLTQWDWQIIGARAMTLGERTEFEAWEGRDDQ
jgi:hypothetical protein